MFYISPVEENNSLALKYLDWVYEEWGNQFYKFYVSLIMCFKDVLYVKIFWRKYTRDRIFIK